jgi:predicted ArsR family transcriptional regulator
LNTVLSYLNFIGDDMALTNTQQRILTAIKQNDWLSATEIAEITGIAHNHIRTALKTKAFFDIDRGIRDTKANNGGRYIRVYRYPLKNKNATEQALKLASQHAGIFGQLYWANNKYENISRVA